MCKLLFKNAGIKNTAVSIFDTGPVEEMSHEKKLSYFPLNPACSSDPCNGLMVYTL